MRFFCSRGGSKMSLAVIFWEALGKSAREVCALVAPVQCNFPCMLLRSSHCSRSIIKIYAWWKSWTEIKAGKLPSASTWDIFFFLKWTFREAEGPKMRMPRSDPLVSPSLSAPVSSIREPVRGRGSVPPLLGRKAGPCWVEDALHHSGQCCSFTVQHETEGFVPCSWSCNKQIGDWVLSLNIHLPVLKIKLMESVLQLMRL